MEKELRFIELRAKGWSYDRIAKEIDTSKPTLIKWSRKHSLEIENQRQLEIDSLREALKLDRRSRLRSFATIVDSLEARIAGADFSDMPVHSAISALLKINELFLSKEGNVTLTGEQDFIDSLVSKDTWIA